MKHLGDITKINGAEVPTVDVVIGGSPCQNFSVAGNRKGLEGEESSLFDEQPRIIKEMRKQSEASGATEIKPRYFVWENVPGAFSTHGGEDFRKALEAVVKIADENASIPRPTGGGYSMANKRRYYGKRILHRLACTRRTVLGSPPATP